MTLEGATGIVPVMDVNQRNVAGYDGNNWFMWVIALFALMNGGFGFNRFGEGAAIASGALTRDQLADEFSYNDIKNGIRGIQNGMCDGFYAQNTTMLQGFNNLGREVLDSRYQLGDAISQNRFAAQQCCCETNRNIDSVRAENYKNTCEITTAIHAEGEATRALINANVMQELRDRLNARDRELMTANFQLSQQAQSANLINTLKPQPQPAYLTCSPYQAANVNPTGYGCANLCNGLA